MIYEYDISIYVFISPEMFMIVNGQPSVAVSPWKT